jgi:beta-galactosidase
LFVNDKSYGVKKRDSQDFPAAGLRWMVPMHEGDYHFRVVAKKGKVEVEDEIRQYYQTAKWKTPKKIELHQFKDDAGLITVEARLLDDNGIRCLDARNWVYFSLAGDGALIDNQGTSSGSRKVQVYNGRAVVRLKPNRGRNVICVKSEGMQTVFLNLSDKPVTP